MTKGDITLEYVNGDFRGLQGMRELQFYLIKEEVDFKCQIFKDSDWYSRVLIDKGDGVPGRYDAGMLSEPDKRKRFVRDIKEAKASQLERKSFESS